MRGYHSYKPRNKAHSYFSRQRVLLRELTLHGHFTADLDGVMIDDFWHSSWACVGTSYIPMHPRQCFPFLVYDLGLRHPPPCAAFGCRMTPGYIVFLSKSARRTGTAAIWPSGFFADRWECKNGGYDFRMYGAPLQNCKANSCQCFKLHPTCPPVIHLEKVIECEPYWSKDSRYLANRCDQRKKHRGQLSSLQRGSSLWIDRTLAVPREGWCYVDHRPGG